LRLPQSDSAVISDRKISHYLLSLTHPSGSSKARFFFGVGFRSDEPDHLKETLLTHGRTHPVMKIENNPFGTKYIIESDVLAPNGNYYAIISVWIIGSESDFPYLVTAYPSN